MDTEAGMREVIAHMQRIAAFAADTIHVYETLEQRLRHEPEAKTLLMPLVFKHMLQYNTEHHVIDPVLLATAGQYLSVRYGGLQEFFGTTHSKELFQQLAQQVTASMEEQDETPNPS
jgi:hypothetical protein